MPRPPKTFEEFVGQRRVCEYERRLVEGALKKGFAVPSQLLIGPSGVGKSTLAAAIARARKTELVTLFAGKETTATAICDALLRLRDCGVLFVDEIHALNRTAQEILSNALSTKQVPKRTEKGGLDRTLVDNLAAHFTVIAATTDPGLLASALLTRLQPVILDAYSVQELKQIGQRVAEQRQFKITPQALRRIAEVAQGLPRTVERLMEQLPTFFPRVDRFKAEHVSELLEHIGIDEQGLSELQRRYVAALAQVPSKCRSLSSIAGRLGCDPSYVRKEVEPHLVNMGLVEIEARGRVLTDKGVSAFAEFEAATKGRVEETQHEDDGEAAPDGDEDADAGNDHDADGATTSHREVRSDKVLVSEELEAMS